VKSKYHLFGLTTLVVPDTAQAYGASGGAIIEFYSLCILIPFGIIIFFSTKYLKLKAPLVLHTAFVFIGFLSIVGTLGMAWSFKTEVGYRPVVIGMHILLVIFVYLAAKHIYRVVIDS
jgi:hypothetical protein